jgi:cell fate (sporulation/competence/biofilm development) regulator YlbF (YheA/YmcA/DUF963 family)
MKETSKELEKEIEKEYEAEKMCEALAKITKFADVVSWQGENVPQEVEDLMTYYRTNSNLQQFMKEQNDLLAGLGILAIVVPDPSEALKAFFREIIGKDMIKENGTAIIEKLAPDNAIAYFFKEGEGENDDENVPE